MRHSAVSPRLRSSIEVVLVSKLMSVLELRLVSEGGWSSFAEVSSILISQHCSCFLGPRILKHCFLFISKADCILMNKCHVVFYVETVKSRKLGLKFILDYLSFDTILE